MSNFNDTMPTPQHATNKTENTEEKRGAAQKKADNKKAKQDQLLERLSVFVESLPNNQSKQQQLLVEIYIKEKKTDKDFKMIESLLKSERLLKSMKQEKMKQEKLLREDVLKQKKRASKINAIRGAAITKALLSGDLAAKDFNEKIEVFLSDSDKKALGQLLNDNL